jgi:uncharacterized protein YegP (UPF0339 family)
MAKLIRLIPIILIGALSLQGCDRVTGIFQSDRLYFCEKYVPLTNTCEGEGSKFTAGKLTVMVHLKEEVKEQQVNINITDKASGTVYNTIQFEVEKDKNYFYFENINFDKAGAYKVSLLTNDGTVIATSDIEIIEKQSAYNNSAL